MDLNDNITQNEMKEKIAEMTKTTVELNNKLVNVIAEKENEMGIEMGIEIDNVLYFYIIIFVLFIF
jgi:hypothetical protein